jgi:hypothetical protein
MSSLPFPLRLAAGVLAAGIDTVRRLPAELPSLGVRLAGNAAKLAFQVRNEITELAIRGDELLDGSPAAQEKPAWATFDDDEPEPEVVSAPRRARPADLPDTGIGEEAPGWSDPLADSPTGSPDGADGTAADRSAEAIVAGYGSLTLGQLRSRLTTLGLDQLRSLLAAEELGARRPAFLTLISNRISTLERTGS